MAVVYACLSRSDMLLEWTCNSRKVLELCRGVSCTQSVGYSNRSLPGLLHLMKSNISLICLQPKMNCLRLTLVFRLLHLSQLIAVRFFLLGFLPPSVAMFMVPVSGPHTAKLARSSKSDMWAGAASHQS